MKKLKYILLFIVAVGLFNSCESVVDTKDVYDIMDGKNLVMFSTTKQTATQIAESGEHATMVKVKLEGPTTANVLGDLTVTIAVDTASTAVEGTHYRLDNTVLVLKESENYIGLFNFTMLTGGIQTPLDVSPVLVLKVTAVNGDGKVINSGKPVNVTLSYACPSELQGTYNVHTVRSDGNQYDWTETISKIGIGTYLTEYVGTWIPPLNPDYGFVFTDVCGVLNVPQQGLADMYLNNVQGAAPGSVDPETGVMVISYTIGFSAGDRTYTSTYTPVD